MKKKDKVQAFVGRVEGGCPKIKDKSCDLAITSPPYFKRDGYSPELMLSLGEVFGRVLKPGHRAYMVFGQIKEEFDRPMKAQQLVIAGAKGKLAAGQTINWVKSIVFDGLSRGHFQPINSDTIMNYCWEHVFCFVKKPVSDQRPLARKSIGVPYADPTNVKRWKAAGDNLHCPGDAWLIPYPTTGASVKKAHRHEFPEELARRLIVLNDLKPHSMVFDPFLGGGTTVRVALSLKLRACGYDKNAVAVAEVLGAYSDQRSKSEV